ncbi:MAG: hypothetical protein GY791_13155 [Alphaproteobacteria bacterium]|nr:hypothetical protein [Alphaproteobacteria bacterium]
MSDDTTLPTGDDAQKARNLLLITYVLYGLSLINGLTAVAGVIIAHIKVNEVTDEFLQSHYRWLIRTFWLGLIAGIIAGVLTVIFIGFLLLLVVFLWYIYRLVKGFLRFNDGKPIEDPGAWL